ncbi:MAG: dTDP-4-dehydrorhamnose 3,5-epimerase [Bacteroidia bacterium]|jgi:dTDP-4-dehydrorhamnose 3,5-epimerase|nr:dTDP-4-dehydrorhamnose 3,5-epimerase [Bacteroidia bacterium]GIV22725.1 MAG: dTDP-4-dehydrorhamnose 3,5-epimerase [Bacteroidia bacterium]
MIKEPLPLEGAFLVHLPRHRDNRGYFAELFRESEREVLGLPPFLQDNLSFSRKGVLRGLHFQRPPQAQAKLITAVYGTIQDVVVDLRPTSPTYKQWVDVQLSGDSERLTWVYVPVGFAHGFLVLSSEAVVVYRCSAYYAPHADGGIRWDDPELTIAWALPSGEKPILSPKDAALPFLSEIENPFAS